MTTLELITDLVIKTNTNIPLMRKEMGHLLRSGQHSLTEILDVDLLLYKCFPNYSHPCSITFVKIALSLATTYKNDLSKIGHELHFMLKTGQTELENAIGVGQIFHYWLGSPKDSPVQRCGFFAKERAFDEEVASTQQQKVPAC